MAGRKPRLENELPLVYADLAKFSARERTLYVLVFDTGFCISEMVALNVGDFWGGERVRQKVNVTRAKLKGRRGVRKKGISSRTYPVNERLGRW